MIARSKVNTKFYMRMLLTSDHLGNRVGDGNFQCVLVVLSDFISSSDYIVE